MVYEGDVDSVVVPGVAGEMGILPHHAIDTIMRLVAGFALAAVVGVVVGFAMGRWRLAEDMLLPLVSIAAPIPGFAYAPLFLLWFGLGNFPTILLVGFVSMFPIIFNTWTGVKAVKEIWLRAAGAMGADNRQLFRHVILPGALPYILTGMRLGLAQALLHDPELFILDEPTDGVDPVGRSEMRSLLLRLKQAGKTIFLNSHHLQEIELVCDRVAILQDGLVRREGRVADLTLAPQTELYLTLSGSEPAIRQAAAAPSGSPFGSAGGIAGPFEVLVHPENEARARELLETSGAEPDSG